jgi:hypothetical protein
VTISGGRLREVPHRGLGLRFRHPDEIR